LALPTDAQLLDQNGVFKSSTYIGFETSLTAPKLSRDFSKVVHPAAELLLELSQKYS